MEPEMPNALPRSFGSLNVVVSSDSAAGASSAPNAPWQARRDQHGEAGRRSADGGHGGEPDQPGEEGDLAADQVGEATAEQQQGAERQRVGGHHPLPVHRAEPQRFLRGRQRDVHDRDVQHHHQLRQADHAQDEPPPPVPGAVGRRHIRHDIHTSFSVVTACARKHR